MQIVKGMNTRNKGLRTECQRVKEDRERKGLSKGWERFMKRVMRQGTREICSYSSQTTGWTDRKKSVWYNGKPKLVHDHSFLSKGIDRTINQEVATGNTGGLSGETSPSSSWSRL